MAKITITSLSSSGTGKTTNFAQIAYAVALAGYQVKIIELDDRNSLKKCCGLRDVDPSLSTSAIFKENFKGKYPFVPFWEDYLKGKAEIIQVDRDEQRKTIAQLTEARDAIALRKIIAKSSINCDLLILDCPGRSDIMSDAAILASTHILLGIEATEKCFEDVAYFFEYLYQLEEKWGVDPSGQARSQAAETAAGSPDLPKIAGFLVGRFDLESSYQREALKQLKKEAENLDCELFNPIRRSPYFLNCYSVGLPLRVYASHFAGNKDFTTKGNFFKRKNKSLSTFSAKFRKLPAIVPYLIEEIEKN